MKRKLNILQTYDYMKLGGAETHIIGLSKGLAESGHKVFLAAPEGPAVEWIDQEKVKFILCSLDNQEKQTEALHKLVSIIEENNIDIIHAHPFNSHIIGSLAAYITDIPCVTTLHGAYPAPCYYEPVKNIIGRVICVSQEILEYARNNNIPEEKLLVIPNSVFFLRPPDKKAFFPENKIRITYISRLDSDKVQSLYHLLNTVSILSKKFDISLNIIGAGECSNDVNRLVNDINSEMNEKRINIIGGTTNTNYYIERSDIIAGIGRVVLESLAMGKFCICIGNNRYPGIVDKAKLLEIAKVNFTDRNSNDLFSSDRLLRDIEKIVYNFDEQFESLVETCSIASQLFSYETNCLKHENCYREALAGFQCVSGLGDKWKMPYPVDNRLIEFLTNPQKGKYQMDNAKPNKILIRPDFTNPEDQWLNVLEKLVSTYSSEDPVTIVIRILNEYSVYAYDIVEKLDMILSKFNMERVPDILIDMEYNDYLAELSLLSSVKYFAPTNSSHDFPALLHRLVKGKTIDFRE